MTFEVASIKPTDAWRGPSFPLDPGDAYTNTRGRFSAVFPLTAFIEFAYKLGCNVIQLDGIPENLTPVLKKK